jgi:hypothetical protein
MYSLAIVTAMPDMVHESVQCVKCESPMCQPMFYAFSERLCRAVLLVVRQFSAMTVSIYLIING